MKKRWTRWHIPVIPAIVEDCKIEESQSKLALYHLSHVASPFALVIFEIVSLFFFASFFHL
jgi:hypothetical protein